MSRLALVITGLILAAFLVMTHQRNEIWRNEVRLWEDTQMKSPEKPRAWHGMIGARIKAGDLTSALRDVQKALTHFTDVNARDRFLDQQGDIYLRLERHREAADSFHEQAVAIPTSRSWMNTGSAYFRAWLTDRDTMVLRQALSAYERAIELDANNGFAVDGYADVTYYLGLHVDLITEWSKRELTRNEAYCAAKWALNDGRLHEALPIFETVRRSTEWISLLYNIAYTKHRMGDIHGAIAGYIDVLHMDPLQPEAHFNLGKLYQTIGQIDLAKAELVASGMY
jgi:tetratricopeptide (TPR) repeat protein